MTYKRFLKMTVLVGVLVFALLMIVGQQPALAEAAWEAMPEFIGSAVVSGYVAQPATRGYGLEARPVTDITIAGGDYRLDNAPAITVKEDWH